MNAEIEIPVTQLKSVMPGLAKIVPRSSTLPVLQCVRVSLSQDEKTIELQVHNLDEIATARVPSKATGLSGQLLVPLDMLTKIVKGCPPGQSVRLIGTKEETKIRYPVAGSFVDRLVTHIPVSEWPEVKAIDGEPVRVDEAFKAALREAMECASVDSSRYVLNGACLDVRHKDAHYVVGTDGRHMYAANSFAFNLPEHLIIPTGKFLAWPAFAGDGPWTLRMVPAVKPAPKEKGPATEKEEPAWFRIDSEHWSYLARAIDGIYPDWKQVVPTDTTNWTKIILQPSAVKTILDAAPLLPGGEDASCPVTLTAGNGLLLKAKGKDQTEWTSINVPEASITGRAVEIRLNRTYLLRALRFGLHQIEIHTSLEPLVFTSTGKTMVIMPLRIEEPANPTPAADEIPPQPKNTSAAPPSTAEVQTLTEERKEMAAPTMTAPERGNLRANNNNNAGRTEGEDSRSAFKTALEHIDRIKTNLRDVLSDLGEAVSLLKAAKKEQKVSAKEIDTIRNKLREIQSVEI